MTFKGKKDQIKEYESQEGYNKYALLYKKDKDFLNSFDQKLFLREIRSLSGLKMLDAGCGDGRLVPLLKKRGATDVVGLDISQEMLLEAKKLGFYQDLISHDLRQELPFDWNTFDAIFCSLVIVHISERDLQDVFAELFRTIKDGGKIYMVNIAQRRAPLLESQDHEKFYIRSYQHSDSTVAKYLSESGFSNIRMLSQEEEGHKIASLIIGEKHEL